MDEVGDAFGTKVRISGAKDGGRVDEAVLSLSFSRVYNE
jgi:hypothetical protein